MKRAAALWLVLLLSAAFGLRLGAAAWWHQRHAGKFAYGDSESYWSLARSIARGEPYAYGEDRLQVFRTPGYPGLLAPLFLLSSGEPSTWWARVLSAALDTSAVAGVGWLASRLFDARAGWIAAVLAAVFPGSIAVGILVLSEAPFCPLMLLHLGLWAAAWQAGSSRLAGVFAFTGGLAAGAATLMRPSWLLFVPFALGLALVFGKARKRHLAIGLLMLLGLCAAMAPWWIRNARVTGRFVPTTLQVGASLYDGLGPQADGSSEMTFVREFEAAERRLGRDADYERRLDRRMRDASLEWTRTHPRRALELAWIKFQRMWNPGPNEAALSRGTVQAVVAGTYVPVLALGLIGAALFMRRGWPYVLCGLPAVYFTLLHVIFVSSIRYRQPAMLGLMVLAAGVISGAASRVGASSRAKDRAAPPRSEPRPRRTNEHR